jgi:class 3 adenylate cyclase/tetratricopeptide (TPR) repeat protein
LFSDIVDSTSFIDGLDPEDADARLAPTLNSMLAAVHLYGGTVSSMRGDGLSALFGAPLAFEDHAARACLSGIAMLDGVRSAGQGLKIRIGIHSGEVLVRSVVADFTQVYEATGPTVHIAARMEQLASPDTVRITRATRDLSRGLVREHLLGLIPVRGISESIEQYEFTSAAPTRTRWDIRAQSRLTAFVGRRSELLVLSKAWHDACRKRGRAITLVGDPGVGKSRILHEFIVSNESVSRSVHVAASASYETHSTFLALSRIVRGWLGIEDGATSATIVQCITSSCNSASTDDIRALHSMLDRSWSDEAWEALEPETRRRMMIQAAARFIQFAAERSPVVIVFEDLHWMDAGTIEFVRYLASDLEGRAILLLCTTRPETTVEKLGLLLEEMPIDTLSREEAISLLDQLLGKSADLQKFKLGLIVKSAGTPLFLEEVVQSLIERAVLVKTGDGYRLMSSLKELSVPATVQAVIAARIDNLPDQPLALLQKAAIIGAEGPRHLLLSIAALGHSEFDQRLAVLEARGFLRLLGDNFAFKHVLTREVVYDSILSETRQAAHLDVVRSIEEQSSKFGNENAEALARHSLAGLDWPRAAKYFRIAAERASEFSAFHESAAHLRIVLMSLEKLGTSNKVLVETIDTLLSLRRALFAAGDLSPILGHLTKAAELAEQIGDEARLAAANIFISNLYSHRGRLDEAIETGSRALAIAQRLGDFNLQISASIVLSLAYEFGGRSREVVASLEPIAATVDADMDHPHFATSASFSVQCIAILAGAFASLGRFEDADQYAKRAVELARKRGRPYDVGLATYYLALVQLRRARIDETIAIVQGGIRDAVGFVIPWLHSALGYAYLVKGDAAEARALLEDVHERCRLMGLDFLTVRTTAWLAFANLRLGDTATAERLSASALARASAHSYRELEAWLLRLRATLRFNQTPQDHADAVTMVESALGITAELGLELERTHCIRVLAEITDGLTAMPIANDAYVQMGIAMSDAEPALMLQFARQHRI